MMRKALPELGIAALLLLLPLLLFAPVALGSETLLPADTLYLFEPYRADADGLGVSYPHNHLVADLVLENYTWKRLVLEAIDEGELPLWDPYLFSGHPFLANGQHSALYPLSLVFYLLPLWRAYGVFAWLQLGLAGVFTYLFARVLGLRRFGSVVAAVTFQFSSFMVTSSAAHPMVVAGASWLPFCLAMVELIVRRRPLLNGVPARLPWAVLGAVGVGCQVLAGHAENTYFVLLVTLAYALWRVAHSARHLPAPPSASGRWREPLLTALWIGLMLALGLALGAAQLIPLYEVAASSFRGGEAAASLEQVLGWAYPPRRVIAFLVPNFFGNPAHHSYLDLFTVGWKAAPEFDGARFIDWGVKNYVEGAAYAGILPLLFAAAGVLRGQRLSREREPEGALGSLRSWFGAPHVPFLTMLAIFSLACAFGTPLYALVYQLPLLSQSHSPFRWIFPFALCVALLAGFGAEAVRRSREITAAGGARRGRMLRVVLLGAEPSLPAWLAAVAFWGGLATLVLLGASRLFFVQIEPLVAEAFESLGNAPQAFPDHRAFYSYELLWLAVFGLLLTGAGIVLRVSRCPIAVRGRPIWEYLALVLILIDLCGLMAGFHASLPPSLLEHKPAAVEFLERDQSLWRYAVYAPEGTTRTMQSNVGAFFGLQSVAGYDSLFPRQYSDFMSLIEEQDELLYLRIAPFSELSSLESPLVDLLNVKYVVTEAEIPLHKYEQVYEDQAVRIYENLEALPRAFTLPVTATVLADDVAAAMLERDPHHYVVVNEAGWDLDGSVGQRGAILEQVVSSYRLDDVEISATVSDASWLVLADSYFPGWRAYVSAAGERAEEEREIHLVDGNFRGVLLEPGAWTVRFSYSPDSVKAGLFASFVAGMILLFLIGLYLWRAFYREDAESVTVRRVAKNSLAPIALNLFNQAIILAFAAVTARILGPRGTGRYDTAVAIYLWFETFVNFGLDAYLMREAARDRQQARRVFVNATLLRLLLLGAAIPLLGGYLLGQQGLAEPLPEETVWALVLLYVGLLPGCVANGLGSMFRACEKHEYPAAVQTVTTIIRVTLGMLALSIGLGVIGLASAAILTNVATLVVLAVLARRLLWPDLPRGRPRFAPELQRSMLSAGWPLMASILLQQLFPGLNVLLLQQFQGDTAVGWYGAARRWVDALVIVPSFFTIAVFPVMSRQAATDRAGLLRSYRLSVKLLTIAALPAAVLVTLLATPLVALLGGGDYLPEGAAILRLLIWSILFGWFNSLTNYLLIALDRQRYVLGSSAVRVAFTLVANVLLVPTLGYTASALIIIGGEFVLAVIFYAEVRRQLGPVGILSMQVRPLLAGAAMGVTVWALAGVSVALALVGGVVAYPAALLALKGIARDEWEMLAPVLPARLRRFLWAQTS
jgi:O-antigen/teichoic acid export membrane protein